MINVAVIPLIGAGLPMNASRKTLRAMVLLPRGLQETCPVWDAYAGSCQSFVLSLVVGVSGKYSPKAARGYSSFEVLGVTIGADRAQPINIILRVAKL